VLLGTTNDRVRRLGHDRVTTFGIGVEHPKATWHSVARQLLTLGYLEPDPAGHGGLRLGPDCRALLRGEARLTLRRDSPAGARRERRTAPSPETEVDAAAWEALRRWRRETADAEGVPPYVIFHDATLRALLQTRPTTLEALAEVPGIGRHKLERYGERVLAALAEVGRE